MEPPLYVVDAFAQAPFSGNPAGVCLLDEERPEGWMQSVAAEVGASETAFCWPFDHLFTIRYFTPMVEVPLCGHATLATACVLWSERLARRDRPIRFQARAETLYARYAHPLIQMDFPALPPDPCKVPDALSRVLGAQPVRAGRIGEHGYLAELADERTVRDLSPDFCAMLEAGFGRVIVTALCEDGEHDFVSRYFAPGVGVSEDPVTGVAHTSLGPWWAEVMGRTRLVGHQVSRRGGVVEVEVIGDRVMLSGSAVMTFRGRLLV